MLHTQYFPCCMECFSPTAQDEASIASFAQANSMVTLWLLHLCFLGLQELLQLSLLGDCEMFLVQLLVTLLSSCKRQTPSFLFHVVFVHFQHSELNKCQVLLCSLSFHHHLQQPHKLWNGKLPFPCELFLYLQNQVHALISVLIVYTWDTSLDMDCNSYVIICLIISTLYLKK